MTSFRKQTPFLFICLLCPTLAFFGQMMHDFTYNYVSMIVPIVLFILFLGKRASIPLNRNFFIVSVLSSVAIIGSYVLVGGGLGSVISNLNTVLLIYIFYHITFNIKEIKGCVFYYRIFHIYLILLILLSGYSSGGYLFGNNANSLGIQAFINLAFFCLYPTKNKILQLFFILSSLSIIVVSGSRTSLITSLLFLIILYLLTTTTTISHKLIRLMFWITIVFGIFFSFFYSYMLPQLEMVELLVEQSISRFDKNIFTGREAIWGLAWEGLLKTPKNFLFGIGSHFLGDNDSNFHNSYFSIFICSGVIGYTLLMILFSKIFLKKEPMQNGIFSDLNLLFFPFMIIGFTESTLFTGIFAIQTFLLLAVFRNRDVIQRLKHS